MEITPQDNNSDNGTDKEDIESDLECNFSNTHGNVMK